MLFHQTQVRVRYADTDQMQYVYYGKYPEYFEVARTELIRAVGLTYKEMEAQGVMLPVAELNIRYFRPALYDDLLTIKTTISQFPDRQLITNCEIFNENGDLLTRGIVKLVYVNTTTMRPMRAPEWLVEKFQAMWQEDEA
ncbi:MAG: acyl-CoA thioesterase [Bacteroidia bacterium]